MSLTTIAHKLITPANNHGIVSAQLGPYASATTRRLEVLTGAQEGLVAQQLDNHTYWMVGFNGTGYSWQPLTSGPEVTFNGNFASLQTSGLYTCGQPDRALVEHATLLNTAGSGPVLTLSGTRTGAPVPIWVRCPTTGGARGTWLGEYSFNEGSSWTGFTSAATVALTGAGAGLTLNIATGTAGTTFVCKAVATTMPDQSGLGADWTQPTAGQCPLIVIGANGKTEVLFDGVDDWMQATLTLPAPATTNLYISAAQALYSRAGQSSFYSSFSATFVMQSITGALTDCVQYNGVANVNSQTVASGARHRMIAKYTGSTSDSLKLGSATAVTGGNAGNSGGGAVFVYIGATGGSNPGKMSLGVVQYASNDANRAVIDASITSYFAGQYAV